MVCPVANELDLSENYVELIMSCNACIACIFVDYYCIHTNHSFYFRLMSSCSFLITFLFQVEIVGAKEVKGGLLGVALTVQQYRYTYIYVI